MYNWLDERGKSQQKKIERQLEEYRKGWCEFMVDIWHDRLMQLHIHDTGALVRSIRGEVVSGEISSITHKFLMYGIYVAAGVGNGYRHGNSGKDDERGLQFLRGERGKNGKHHKRRDWFSKKYFYSIHRLNEKEGKMLGQAYNGMLIEALDQLFMKESVLRSL